MRTITAICLLAVGLCWAQVEGGDQKKDDKAAAMKLVGTYRIVSGSKGDQKTPSDRLDNITMRIAANAMTTYTKDKKEVYAATYELDTSRKPWRITMTTTIGPAEDKGTKAEGLIEIYGDTVRLIYALPGGKAPTEFKTAEKQQMFVLKKLDK